MWLLRCIILLSVAAVNAESRLNQTPTAFRPPGYNDTIPLDVGRGPDLNGTTVHLPRSAVSSQWCEGRQDVLSFGVPAPVVGNLTAKDFSVRVCQTTGVPGGDGRAWQITDECQMIVPACARTPLEDTANQRRTILLFGSFIDFKFEANWRVPTKVPNLLTVWSVKFLIDGETKAVYGAGDGAYTSGQSFNLAFNSGPGLDGFTLGGNSSDFIVDAAVQDLSAPLNTAAADPDGCAAFHPSATYAIRLLFAYPPYDRASFTRPVSVWFTMVVPDIGDAAAFISLRTGVNATMVSPDQVLGVAGAPGGAAVDVCVKAASREPQVEAVVMDCAGRATINWGHDLCGAIHTVFLRSEEDQLAGRDRATYTTNRTVEFCFSSTGGCPGDPRPQDANVATSPDATATADCAAAGGEGSTAPAGTCTSSVSADPAVSVANASARALPAGLRGALTSVVVLAAVFAAGCL